MWIAFWMAIFRNSFTLTWSGERRGRSPVPTKTSSISEAARLILAGELVAFPTETVYGLGANALDAAAVDRIFAVKGRPATSPLIVHVDSIEMAQTLVTDWPDKASRIAQRF